MKIDSNNRNSSRTMNRSGFRINIPFNSHIEREEKSSDDTPVAVKSEENKPIVTQRLAIATPTLARSTLEPLAVTAPLQIAQVPPETLETACTIPEVEALKSTVASMGYRCMSVSEIRGGLKEAEIPKSTVDETAVDETAELKEKIELLENQIEILTTDISTKDEMIKTLKDYVQVTDEELQLAVEKHKSLLDITGKFIMKI